MSGMLQKSELEEDDIDVMITSTIINNDQDEKEKEQNMLTTIYKDLLSLTKDFNLQITVPQFLFFGLQSCARS